MVSVEELKNFRFSEDKSIFDDESKTCKCSDSSAMHTKVLDNFEIEKKQDGHINKLFNSAPGETYVPKISDSMSWKRINDQKKSKSLFGDADGDGVLNILDCAPYDKKKQGIVHKVRNMVEGRGFQDKTPLPQQQSKTVTTKAGTFEAYGRRVPPVPVKQTFRSLKKEGGEFFSDIGKVTGKMNSKQMSSKMGLGGGNTNRQSGFNMMLGLQPVKRKKVKMRKKSKYRYVTAKPETGEEKIRRLLG